MFGGGGFGGGGYGGGGYGGTGGGVNDAAAPMGGGAAFGAAAPSQGLRGFLDGGQNDPAATNAGSPSRAAGGQQQRQAQTLTPVTIRLLQDAINQQKSQGGGQDTPYCVNGRELGMLTLVACVESSEQGPMFKKLKMSDGSGRIDIHHYTDSDGPSKSDDLRVGDYVRVFGHLRAWQGTEGISAHHIAKVENANEIAYHAVEVAHVHLASTGRLVKAPPGAPSLNNAGARPAASSSGPPPGSSMGGGGMLGGALAGGSNALTIGHGGFGGGAPAPAAVSPCGGAPLGLATNPYGGAPEQVNNFPPAGGLPNHSATTAGPGNPYGGAPAFGGAPATSAPQPNSGGPYGGMAPAYGSASAGGAPAPGGGPYGGAPAQGNPYGGPPVQSNAAPALGNPYGGFGGGNAFGGAPAHF